MPGSPARCWIFAPVLPTPALAERLMRTAWPMLWLLPTMAGTAAIAWRIAGREAALIALLLALVGLPAFHQFRPGRIDHHNVQIALSRAGGRRDRMVGPRALGGRRGGCAAPASRSRSGSNACPI